MKYSWGCGCSFEWAEAEAHYSNVLATCGDYCDLRLDSEGVHDPAPCMDHWKMPPSAKFDVDMAMGPEANPQSN